MCHELLYSTIGTMEQLTKRVKIGYGVGDLGGNLFFTMSGFYLLFYLTDVVGLAAGLAGTALMIGKIWDAVTDPVVGYLSDRTPGPFGRRRPWIFAGVWLTWASLIWMFSPPGSNIFLWVILANCVLNTGYTFINIPYGALTPDLTTDFNERTLLNGYRMSFAVIGTFIGAGGVLVLVDAFGGGLGGWRSMSVVIGGVMAIASLAVVVSVKEKPYHEKRPRENIFVSYRQVLRLKPFLLALIPWALHITGVNIIQGALLYYFRFIYGDEAAFQIALPILLASAIVCIPLWVRISRSIGKRASYNIGMGIFAVTILIFFLIGHRTGPGVAFLLMGIGGIGFATQYVMPFSILPDVVEYDYAEHGVRREGVFYGQWTFMSKLGQALGIAINGWILTLFSYQESVGGIAMEQTESALFGIRLIAGPVPALFFILGILVLRHYPITNEYYRTILEKIARREATTTTEG